eukprot:CAMPEP_0202007178 /NCGR_PEP_ID=MMETSP0905-20130828/11740_1 /ASSEMBLY_ACC=CAM_ASM_000554 /TAXON_ID=420261 /ORGANISM="Thalassiosira antarctica, Strain CCMP982" /LENGTH=319 /DNA_ID=CAMNT_0048565093 /DNA_START=235 /DNA_END=1190 /DNA_ORIENTATION=+
MQVTGFQNRWKVKYDLLVEYKQEHGHCHIPTKEIIDGHKLGSWADNQRGFYKKGKIPEDRIDRLNEIGFNWSVYDMVGRAMDVSWEEQFEQLVKFKGKHGHYDVPQHDMINSQKLGLWVREQRASYKNGTLLNYRLVRLNEIRFNWSGSYLSWEGRFKQLVEFKGEHGHCHVHLRYLDNPPLGQWLDQQRKRYRGKKLQKDRIDQLNGIDGFTWEARRRGPRAHVGSEDVEQSEADERKNAPVNGEGTLIEGTEAPTAKSTTRGTTQTNDEREPPEISDSQAVRKKRATKRNAPSCNTKEDLQAHWRRKKAKGSAIPES